MVNVPMTQQALKGKQLWRFSDDAIEQAYHRPEETSPDPRRRHNEHRKAGDVDLVVNTSTQRVVYVQHRSPRRSGQ